MPSVNTECPSCSATFHVTEEQLQVAKGKVRCGRCKHIFRAVAQQEEQQSPAGQKFQFDQSAIDNSTAEGFITELEMPLVNTHGEMDSIPAKKKKASTTQSPEREIGDDDLIMDTQMMQAVDLGDTDLSDAVKNIKNGRSKDEKRFNTTFIDDK